MKYRILTALAIVTLSAPAALALGQKECALQAGLVMQAVAARSAGTEAEAAAPNLQGGLDGASQKYAAVVPMIVEWVYSLPESQLTDAVGESWAQACLKQ